jgi:hypothetical protein
LEEIKFNFNQKLKKINIEKKIILFLALIFISALIIRFYYTPFGIPVNLDGFLGYFLYALDISILGHLPNYTLSQSGWGEFLSIFFVFFNSDNLIDYYDLQRTISVILSGITVIPIYFICKKFFNNYYSLIGATIFALEPKIIMNSTLGVSEPLYILAISLGILFFLNYNKKIMYLAFGFFAWATIIRPEGQFWFLAFSIAYFIRFRKNRKDLALYFVCLVIFLLVLSPIVMHRIECCQTDAIFSRFIGEMNNNLNSPTVLVGEKEIPTYAPNFENGIKLLGWSLVPVFIIFLPPGIIVIIRERNYPNYLLIIVPVILSIPIFYSVSIAPDTRYVYPLYPIFCIIALFGIKYIVKENKKIVGIIILIIILTSIAYLDYKKIEYVNDKEIHEISKIIIKDVKGLNTGTEVGKYFKSSEIEKRWPITESSGRLSDSLEMNRFNIKDFNSLEEFIKFEKEEELSHIVIDKSQNMPNYFLDIFDNEDKYSYLIKEFDSHDHGYNYHVKKFKIDYNMFGK